MGPGDLGFVVRGHQQVFPDGFFPRLGPAFLTEYYRTYLSGPSARALVADVDGHLAGFLVGVTNSEAHRQHVMQAHARALIMRAFVALLMRPGLALHFLRTRVRRYYRRLVRDRRSGPGQGVTPARGTVAVLSHVAVTPESRSRGIGSALIERFISDAAAAGCERITLVTAAGPDGAGAYYTHRGWQPGGERRTPEGRRLVAYDCVLEQPFGADGNRRPVSDC